MRVSPSLLLLIHFLAACLPAHSQTFEIVGGFSNDGRASFANVTQGTDGNLYGVAAQGGVGDNFGSVFKVDENRYVTALVRFTGVSGLVPGAGPVASLTLGTDGNFYGTTNRGGAADVGTVFKVTPTGAHTLLAEFTGTTGEKRGANPWGALAWGSDGALYGTTERGGAADEGTVYRITADGSLTTLWEFTSGRPIAGLTLGEDGNFYGSTELGGTNGLGTLFKITPQGALTTIVNFTGTGGAAPGAGPWGRLRFAAGKFYGTTYKGGTADLGSVFTVTPGGNFVSLVSFSGTGGSTRGAAPLAGVVPAPDGNLYGTTWLGGVGDAGTIYRITEAGAFTSVLTFTGNSGPFLGKGPYAELMVGPDGELYGTTPQGGRTAVGTVFKVTTSGALTTLVQFGFTSANGLGYLPSAPPVRASNGDFYGVTQFGGPSNKGTIYKMAPDGRLTTLASFSGSAGPAPGAYPLGRLAIASDGNLYGTQSRRSKWLRHRVQDQPGRCF